MRLIRRFAITIAGLAGAGLASACTCEAPGAGPQPPRPEPTAAAPARSAVPQALGELPALTPMVTLTVRADSFEVDNRALVDTWPAPDRARVESPHVHAEVPAPGGESLLVPALHDAMWRAMEVEQTRAAGSGTPIAFALRVDGDAPWRRAQQAVYTAGQAGWVEPRFVLRAARGGGEVVLSLPLPRFAPSAEQAERLEHELAALLEGRARPAEAAEPTQPVRDRAPLLVTLTDARALELRVRGELLDASCARSGASGPTLPPSAGATDIAGLGRCLDTALASEALAIGTVRLAPAPALTFDDVAPVLETLRARSEVALVAAP